MTDEETIDWPEALRKLEEGEIVLAGQTHNLAVTLTDAKGHRYVTREPEIDAIVRAINDLPAETRNKIALLSE
jgi:hypothetical protein